MPKKSYYTFTIIKSWLIFWRVVGVPFWINISVVVYATCNAFFVFGRALHICSAFLYLVVLRVFAAHVLSILICWCFFLVAYVFLCCSTLSSLGLRKNEPHWPVNDVTMKIPNSYFFIFNSALQYIHWIFFVSLKHCALTDIFLHITTAVFSMHSKNL